MPAVTKDPLLLDRIPQPAPDARTREPVRVARARRQLEGAGFEVRRPLPGPVTVAEADPFLMLDHVGGAGVEVRPGEMAGAPDHPHRGFETVSYILDGELEHRDSTGGGGIIRDGGTQWMTAGAGIVHSEMPPAAVRLSGGPVHGVQLWVNLPASSKMVTPRYQDIGSGDITLLASHDGASLIRLIAGSLAGHDGPGRTWTPVTYLHATVAPGARLVLPWRADFNALAYALAGAGRVGTRGPAIVEGSIALLGAGDLIEVRADTQQPENAPAGLEVLVLGGAPLREPVAWYGPFVMNTEAQLRQAVEDYHAGRMGVIPPVTLPHAGAAPASDRHVEER